MLNTNAPSLTWERDNVNAPSGMSGCGGDGRYYGVVRYTILIPQNTTEPAPMVMISHPDCFDIGIFGGDKFNIRQTGAGGPVVPPIEIDWMIHAGSALCGQGCNPPLLSFDDVPTFFGKTFLVGATMEAATTRTGRLADIQGDRVNAYLVRARVVPPAGGQTVSVGITLSFTRGSCGGAGVSIATGGLIG